MNTEVGDNLGLDTSTGLHVRHYHEDERTVTVISCESGVIGLIAGNTKYMTRLSQMSIDFLSNSKNIHIKDLLENGVRVTPTQMDVYIEHYLEPFKEDNESLVGVH